MEIQEHSRHSILPRFYNLQVRWVHIYIILFCLFVTLSAFRRGMHLKRNNTGFSQKMISYCEWLLYVITKYGVSCDLSLPLGPLILTVSWPAPAPLVSQMNRDWYIANTPCSTPGPYTLTRVGSGAPETRTVNGDPWTWAPPYWTDSWCLPGS